MMRRRSPRWPCCATAAEFPGIGRKVWKPTSEFPLPAATQCEILKANAIPLQPALDELQRQAAQSEVVHNDDTSMRVLSLDRDTDISPERTGVFTSGLIWLSQKRRIALYFTGCKHAGENLAEVLKLRSPDLPPIIQMCDALSRNVPKIVETISSQL